MWLQEIPFRHIWNGTQNGLHCSFSLEQVDRSETQLTCNILVAQSEMSANQQIIHISRNVAQVPLSTQHFYSAPLGERSVVMSLSVCMCVCSYLPVRDHIFGTTRPIFANLFMHVTDGRGRI